MSDNFEKMVVIDNDSNVDMLFSKINREQNMVMEEASHVK